MIFSIPKKQKKMGFSYKTNQPDESFDVEDQQMELMTDPNMCLLETRENQLMIFITSQNGFLQNCKYPKKYSFFINFMDQFKDLAHG